MLQLAVVKFSKFKTVLLLLKHSYKLSLHVKKIASYVVSVFIKFVEFVGVFVRLEIECDAGL